MHAVQRLPKLGRRWVVARIRVRLRAFAVLLAKLAGHQVQVFRPPPAKAEQAQAVLGHRQMTDLPRDVRDAFGRLPKPIVVGQAVQ